MEEDRTLRIVVACPSSKACSQVWQLLHETTLTPPVHCMRSSSHGQDGNVYEKVVKLHEHATANVGDREVLLHLIGAAAHEVHRFTLLLASADVLLAVADDSPSCTHSVRTWLTCSLHLHSSRLAVAVLGLRPTLAAWDTCQALATAHAVPSYMLPDTADRATLLQYAQEARVAVTCRGGQAKGQVSSQPPHHRASEGEGGGRQRETSVTWREVIQALCCNCRRARRPPGKPGCDPPSLPSVGIDWSTAQPGARQGYSPQALTAHMLTGLAASSSQGSMEQDDLPDSLPATASHASRLLLGGLGLGFDRRMGIRAHGREEGDREGMLQARQKPSSPGLGAPGGLTAGRGRAVLQSPHPYQQHVAGYGYGAQRVNEATEEAVRGYTDVDSPMDATDVELSPTGGESDVGLG